MLSKICVPFNLSQDSKEYYEVRFDVDENLLEEVTESLVSS